MVLAAHDQLIGRRLNNEGGGLARAEGVEVRPLLQVSPFLYRASQNL